MNEAKLQQAIDNNVPIESRAPLIAHDDPAAFHARIQEIQHTIFKAVAPFIQPPAECLTLPMPEQAKHVMARVSHAVAATLLGGGHIMGANIPVALQKEMADDLTNFFVYGIEEGRGVRAAVLGEVSVSDIAEKANAEAKKAA